jgi:CDGSH-type Zn-finger protein
MNDNESKPHQVEITFEPGNGFEIKGNFILKDADDKIIPTDNYVKLCRCGKSKKQPLCDNSHLEKE